jgi:glycyl-tRNA synthetase
MALTFLIDAYAEEQVEGEARVVLRLHPRIAPITVGVLPLVKKDGMPERAHAIEAELRELGFSTFYDEKAAIGRRYRRLDEVGTPWCVTIDGDTQKDGTVTVRERDSMQQKRVPAKELGAHLLHSQRTWARA